MEAVQIVLLSNNHSKKEINHENFGKKRTRRKYTSRNGSAAFFRQIVVAVFLLSIIFCGLQWNVYRRLEDAAAVYRPFDSGISRLAKTDNDNNNKIDAHGTQVAAVKTDHANYRFLIFHKVHEAQGAGNHMHGLLAAHLLADEFQRSVCVSPYYTEFHTAFEAIDPVAMQHCPDILNRHNKEPPQTRSEHTIELLNYRLAPTNECAVKDLLASKIRVIHLVANTYPRWPSIPDENFDFFKFYKAKDILLDMLPYPPSKPPPIVVHLREADTSGGDSRKGVDADSLKALGEFLPVDESSHSPFLVTNNVQWFDLFEKEYGWSHPPWQMVTHSALGYEWEGRKTEATDKGGTWWFGAGFGNRKESEKQLLQKKYDSIRKRLEGNEWETLKLWADWYTLLRAQKVYHTYSDFSLSAVHWMNTWSRTYDGIKKETGELILLEENWIIDGESPRLVDRTGADLKHCVNALPYKSLGNLLMGRG